MITFITDKDKNNSPLEDDTPEIGVTSKGQPVEKIIEDAEAANEAEKAEEKSWLYLCTGRKIRVREDKNHGKII